MKKEKPSQTTTLVVKPLGILTLQSAKCKTESIPLFSPKI